MIAWMAEGDNIYEDVLCGNHHTYVFITQVPE